MYQFDLQAYDNVVFFIGAGMSAESGVPTYRGAGGIWEQYRYEEYACQRAFDLDPEKVLNFHEMRRAAVLVCEPHAGHRQLAALQAGRSGIHVITQNIDGMLQRAGVTVEAELHGSLWRTRCSEHGLIEDAAAGAYAQRHCPQCGTILRPDITWFEDAVNSEVFEHAGALTSAADLFVSVGTSGSVWPAAGFVDLARRSGAYLVEINPEDTQVSTLHDLNLRMPASEAIPRLFTN